MKDSLLKKLDFIAGLIPFAAIFGILVVSANSEIKDLDLWLHLAMGKFISLRHFVPDVDVLSCSIQGRPWVNHEWLFQVIIYQIHNAFGPQGLLTLQAVLTSVTMLLLLFLGYSRERQLIVSFILLIVFMIFQQRFTIRPDLFSLLFFTIYIFVLSLHIDKRWAVPVLFIAQVLWSNFHGFFFFGPLFVLIGMVSEWLKRRVRLPFEWNESGRLTDDEFGRIQTIFFVVTGACFLNPLFIEGAWYPVRVFFSLAGENKIFFEHIQELQLPVTWDTLLNRDNYLYFKIMIFLSFISFVLNRRKIDISALLFWLVFLIFSLKASRNQAFFAFAAYLVFITNLLNIRYEDVIPIRFTEPKFQYLTTIVLKCLFTMWLFGYYQMIAENAYYDFDRYELKSEYGGVSQTTYPDKAADFLVRNHVRGNFFNDFNSGAYLLGRTFPDIKVFIDGRTEVYGGGFFKMYQKIWDEGDEPSLDRALKDHGITGALLNSARNKIPEKTLNYFAKHKDWHLVYFDYDGMVYLKDTVENRPLIDRFSMDLAKWEPPVLDGYKIGTMRVKPTRPYYRAYTLQSLGYDVAAEKELRQALLIDPVYPQAHDLMGKIYTNRQDYQNAFDHFRIAAMMDPSNKEMRHNLALVYLDLAKYEGAVNQYQMITKLWPDDLKGHFLLAKAYILDKQYDKALQQMRAIQKNSPKRAREYLELAELMTRQGAYHHARQTYSLALQTGNEQGESHKLLAETWVLENQVKEAVAEYEKALEYLPGSAEIQNALLRLRSPGE